MKKKHVKLVAIMAIISVLFSCYIDSAAFASNEEKVDSTNIKHVEKVRSDNDLKNPYIKQYLNSDGTYTTEIHKYPVRYMNDNGVMKDVDNTLVEIENAKLIDKGYKFKNKKGHFKVNFPDKMQEEKGVLFSANGYDIEFTPISNVQTEVQTAKSVLIQQNDTKQVTYDKVFGANSSIEYEVVPSGIKENIVLQKYDGINRFSFKLTCGDLTPELQESGAILFKENSTEHGEERQDYISMSPIIVYDSSEEQVRDENTNVTLKKTAEGEYTYTIIVDKDYLTADERVYPVYVDPQVRVTSTYIEDAPVYDGLPNENFSSDSIAYLGKNSPYGTGLIFTKFDISSVKGLTGFNKDNIISAYYYMTRSSVRLSGTLTSSRCTSSWNSSSITYTNKPSVSSASGHFVTTSYEANTQSMITCNITGFVKDWVGEEFNIPGQADCGFQTTYAPNSTDVHALSYSQVELSESTVSPPYLEIEHTGYKARSLYAGGVYFIKDTSTNKYLNTCGSSSAFETMPVYGLPYTNSTTSQGYLWKLEYSENNGYKIIPLSPHEPMSTAPYIPHLQMQYDTEHERIEVLEVETSTGNYWWNIVKNSDNTYRILSTQDRSIRSVTQIDVNGYGYGLEIFSNNSPSYEFIPAFQNTGIYYLKNRQSNKYLAYDGSSTIRQLDESSSIPEAIRWRIDISNDRNSVSIKNIYANRYLSVSNGSSANEAQLELVDSNTVDKAKWRIFYNQTPSLTSSNVRVMSKVSSYSKGLTTQQASTNNGAIVFQFEYNDNVTDNDEWELIPMIKLIKHYDDGYLNYSSGDVLNACDTVNDQAFIATRAISYVSGAVISSPYYPSKYQSYADKCPVYKESNNINSLCTCNGTTSGACGINDFTDSVSGHHTNQFNIFTDYLHNSFTTVDNNIYLMYTGHQCCNLTHQGKQCYFGWTERKHITIFQRSNDSLMKHSTLTHELAHVFGTLDHNTVGIFPGYDYCVMSYERNEQTVYNKLVNDYQNISSYLCPDCINSIRMSRHYVSRVGEN